MAAVDPPDPAPDPDLIDPDPNRREEVTAL